MDAIEMPKTYKTYREQLEELPIGESIPVEDDKKASWSTNITRIHASANNKKQFTIRTRGGESKVWRLQDIEAQEA